MLTALSSRRTALAALAGAGVLLALMLALAGAAIAFGWIRPDANGRAALGAWLVLEIAGGLPAGLIAGAVSRRIGRSPRAPRLLAAGVLTLGLLEALAILQFGDAAGVRAPRWLPLLAPVAGAAAVLAGGWRRAETATRVRAPRRPVALPDAIRYALPLAALLASVALARFALPGLGEGTEGVVMASALALDFTITVPALVLFLLVRARRLPWIALIPAFVVGYALAAALLPREPGGVLQALGYLVIPAEGILIGYLIVRMRRALAGASRGDADFTTRFRASARRALGARVPADILTTEVALLYHAFRPPRPAPPDPGAYTVHREAGYLSILIGLLLLIAVETIALHALVTIWGPVASWVLTGLSLYAIVWLVGDYRAMSARPIRVTPETLSLRFGVRWEAEIPIARIVEVAPARPDAPRAGRDVLVAAIIGPPHLVLRLDRPVEVFGMYGIRRSVREIRVQADRAGSLRESLAGAIAAGRPGG